MIAAFVAELEGLSDDPMRRAMEIARAGISVVLTSETDLPDKLYVGLAAAHNELHRALSTSEKVLEHDNKAT